MFWLKLGYLLLTLYFQQLSVNYNFVKVFVKLRYLFWTFKKKLHI